MAGYCLLTGATGLVGRYLLRDLLLRGIPVAVLIRSRDGGAPAKRLEEILRYWDREAGRPLPRTIYCLEGDITLPGLGLDEDDRRWVARHCDRILHNAASLTFWERTVRRIRGCRTWAVPSKP
jgi:thioester reductase-like protein